jgi:hypothetical protein
MLAEAIRRGARAIILAVIAGLVAFEAVLVFGTGAVGIPGVFLVRVADKDGGPEAPPDVAEPSGGESSIVKPSVLAEAAKQAPVEEAANSTTPPPPAGEPRLDGLADIPLKPWVPEPKDDEPKSDDPKAAPAPPQAKEELPWDAVEPYKFTPDGPAAASADATASLQTPATPPAPPVKIALPLASTVEGWVKATATEIKAEERGRALYHFEFGLDAPEEVKRRLTAVAYEFNTPAVMPQALMSSEKKTGFRVSAGGLTCADKVTVTLKFNDGQSQQVAVDGCRLVSKKDAA